MHLHENESVFSFPSSKDEEILLDSGFNLLEDGREDHHDESLKNHKGSDIMNGPMLNPYPILRSVNPHLRMMLQRVAYVNPNDVCKDPFYEPKRVVRYPSVFKNLKQTEKMMSPEGPSVGMNGVEEDQISNENVYKKEEVKTMKTIPDMVIEKIEVSESVKEMEDSEVEGDIENVTIKRPLEDEDEPEDGYKLPASKSPIMEAMSFCAIKKWGIEIEECKDKTEDSEALVIFRVTDFEKYYKYSTMICSKQNPTEDIGSRVKSLRRWFTNFPKKKDRKDNSPFSLQVRPDVSKKVHDMVEKYRLMVNVKKRRRMK